MPSSSSSAQAARERLGAKLRELRVTAGLSGREFATVATCQASKVFRSRKAFVRRVLPMCGCGSCR
jgi:hypothetical protein